MAAADGRCKVMDASADGYVRGEAVGALWLASTATHFPALAVLSASAVNTNGRSSSLTAPHGPTQTALLATALALSGLLPGQVSGLQMHANGTSLGDPIEAGAAASVYMAHRSKPTPSASLSASLSASAVAPFVWASIKGCTGHQEAAAGVVEMMETIGMLSHMYLPPAVNLRNLNPLLEAALGGGGSSMVARGGPMGLPLAGAEGSRSGSTGGVDCRTAFGVSSFGAQGTNAHALLSSPLTSGAAALAVAAGAPSLKSNGHSGDIPWVTRRLWVAPAPSPLLTSIGRVMVSRKRGAVAILVGRLDTPTLSYLWDHCHLQTNLTQPILPNSIIVAAAAAAARMLLISGSAPDTLGLCASAAGDFGVLLTSVLLSPEVPLPVKAGRPGHSIPTLSISLSTDGVLEVSVDSQRQMRARASAVAGSSRLQSSTAEQESMDLASTSSLPSSGVTSTGLLASLAKSWIHHEMDLDSAGLGLSLTTAALNTTRSEGYATSPDPLESSLQLAAAFGNCRKMYLTAIEALYIPPSSVQQPLHPHSVLTLPSCSDDSSLASHVLVLEGLEEALTSFGSEGAGIQVQQIMARTPDGGLHMEVTGVLLMPSEASAADVARAITGVEG